jgi:hypothetical protein
MELRVYHVTNLLDVADAEARLFKLCLQIESALRGGRSLYQRVQEPYACGLQVQTATCAAQHANQKAEPHRLAETQPQSGEGLRHRAVSTPGRLARLRQQLNTNRHLVAAQCTQVQMRTARQSTPASEDKGLLHA